MTQINPYLHLNGTCKEAFNFYKDCIGGEITIQTVGETPMADQMPEAKDKVMHATLSKNGTTFLMGADMMDPTSFKIGDTITVSLTCDNEEEIRSFFAKLSEGGKVDHELKEEFWGGIFGSFTDKYGIDWMLNYQKSPMPQTN